MSPTAKPNILSMLRGGPSLLLGLIVACGLAYVWPSLPSLWSDLALPAPFRLTSSGLWTLVAITMFCLGTVVERHELSELKQRPASVFLGLLTQCGCMPLLAWIACNALGLEGELAAGVILVGCVPGAMASNVLTMTARGNVSYSVCLTAVATLASPLTVPLLLWCFSGLEAAPADPLKTSWALLTTVVMPILAGFGLKEYSSRLAKLTGRLSPAIASLALLWIIASVVAGNRDRLAQINTSVFIALLFMNLAGYAAGWWVARWAAMTPSMQRALSLEVGMQNAGVGTALAATLYGDTTLALIPTAAYTFGCMLTGTILAGIWALSATSPPTSEPAPSLPA